MEHLSPTASARKAYNIGIAVCAFALLAFALFLAIEPAFAAGFGLDAAAPDSLKSQSSIPVIIGRIISALMGLIGVVFLILMLYAGLMWMTARGNVEQATKAKDTIMRAILGIVIVASAYAITSFVIDRVAGSTDSSPSESSSLMEQAPSFAFISTAHAQGLGNSALEQVGKESGIGGKTPSEASEQLPVILGKLIQSFISVLGIVFIILIIYGGWLWLTARGEADRVEQAKSTITRAIIGLVIIFSAYALTSFVISRLVTATAA